MPIFASLVVKPTVYPIMLGIRFLLDHRLQLSPSAILHGALGAVLMGQVFTASAQNLSGEAIYGSIEKYDVVFDVVGKSAFFRALNSVKPGGYFILINPPFAHLLLRLCCGLFSSRKIRFVLAGYNFKQLEYLKQLLASGRIKAAIHRRFTLDQAVEALRCVETNNRIGNVILKVGK